MFPSPLAFNKSHEEIAGALQKFGNRWCMRQHVESYALNTECTWKLKYL